MKKINAETFYKTFYTGDGRPVKLKFFRETRYDAWNWELPGPVPEKIKTGQTDKDKAIKHVAANWRLFEKHPKKTSQFEMMRTIIEIIRDKSEDRTNADVEDIIKEADKQGINRERTEEALQRLKRNGQTYQPIHGKYRVTEY